MRVNCLHDFSFKRGGEGDSGVERRRSGNLIARNAGQLAVF